MSVPAPVVPVRLRELALLVLSLAPAPLTEGELLWLMFAVDMAAYRRLGASISGATWAKGSAGHPVPAEAA